MGNIQKAKITFTDSGFTGPVSDGGTLHGERLPCESEKLNEDLKLLCQINALTAKLRKTMNDASLSVDVKLAQKEPKFKPIQKELLEKIVAEPENWIALIKNNHGKSLEVDDYENDTLFVKSEKFHISAGLKSTAKEIHQGVLDKKGILDVTQY